MRIQVMVAFIICVVLLAGCSEEKAFENFFHKKVKEMNHDEMDHPYALIHTEYNAANGNDAVAVFKEIRDQKEQIYIAYFEKKANQWQWKHTRGSEWDSPIKWTAMHDEPYIYSGALSDDSITEVYAGEKRAVILNVEEGKRFWYVISPLKDVEVTVTKDGAVETLEEINYSEMEN